MPQGDKSSYTSKQKRQARHIEESEMRGGRRRRTAERIAWATVNKQDGGGKKANTKAKKSGKGSAQTRRPTTRGRRPVRRSRTAARASRSTRTRTRRTRAVRARA